MNHIGKSPERRYTVSARQAAEYLGLSLDMVYRFAARGEIPCVRTSSRVCQRVVQGETRTYNKTGRVRFSVADLDTWVAAHHQPANVPARAPRAALGTNTDPDFDVPLAERRFS